MWGFACSSSFESGRSQAKASRAERLSLHGSIARAAAQPIGRVLVQALRLVFRVVFLALFVLTFIHATAAVPSALAA